MTSKTRKRTYRVWAEFSREGNLVGAQPSAPDPSLREWAKVKFGRTFVSATLTLSSPPKKRK